jgi:hypothetical protein
MPAHDMPRLEADLHTLEQALAAVLNAVTSLDHLTSLSHPLAGRLKLAQLKLQRRPRPQNRRTGPFHAPGGRDSPAHLKNITEQ